WCAVARPSVDLPDGGDKRECRLPVAEGLDAGRRGAVRLQHGHLATIVPQAELRVGQRDSTDVPASCICGLGGTWHGTFPAAAKSSEMGSPEAARILETIAYGPIKANVSDPDKHCEHGPGATDRACGNPQENRSDVVMGGIVDSRPNSWPNQIAQHR